MKTIFKSLLVWLLLLAVPFQGFASATTLVCAPLSSPLVASAHAASPAADASAANGTKIVRSEHCVVMAGLQNEDAGNGHSGHRADTKCNSCASCHVGAAIASSDVNRIELETQQFSSIPFDLGFVAVVELDLPERPPQARLA